MEVIQRGMWNSIQTSLFQGHILYHKMRVQNRPSRLFSAEGHLYFYTHSSFQFHSVHQIVLLALLLIMTYKNLCTWEELMNMIILHGAFLVSFIRSVCYACENYASNKEHNVYFSPSSKTWFYSRISVKVPNYALEFLINLLPCNSPLFRFINEQ